MYQTLLLENCQKAYQNTLVGTEFTDLEKELRQTINGIYASSDDVEAKINKLC